jgi:hypothetical protein
MSAPVKTPKERDESIKARATIIAAGQDLSVTLEMSCTAIAPRCLKIATRIEDSSQ